MVKDSQNNDRYRHLQEEVEKTLDVFDCMERLEAGPYFYQRVKARLNSRQADKLRWFPGPVSQRFLKPALLVLLMVVNIVTALYFLTRPRPVTTTEKPLYTYLSSLTERQDTSSTSTIGSYVTEKILESKK